MKMSKAYGISVLFTFIAFVIVNICLLILGTNERLILLIQVIALAFLVGLVISKLAYFLPLNGNQILIPALLGVGFVFMSLVGSNFSIDGMLSLLYCLPSIAIDIYFFNKLKRIHE